MARGGDHPGTVDPVPGGQQPAHQRAGPGDGGVGAVEGAPVAGAHQLGQSVDQRVARVPFQRARRIFVVGLRNRRSCTMAVSISAAMTVASMR